MLMDCQILNEYCYCGWYWPLPTSLLKRGHLWGSFNYLWW